MNETLRDILNDIDCFLETLNENSPIYTYALGGFDGIDAVSILEISIPSEDEIIEANIKTYKVRTDMIFRRKGQELPKTIQECNKYYY